jgi:hypothetical protein
MRGRKRKFYTSNSEIWCDFKKGLEKQFDPFFYSFKTDKGCFIIHTINLVLGMLFLHIPATFLLNKVVNNISGSSVLAMRMLMVVVILIATSLVTDKKVLKWQTLFCMKKHLAKQWTEGLVLLNVSSYCYHERSLIIDIWNWIKKI